MNRNLTENTCRVCLNEQEIMINLFDEVEDFQTKLVDLLENCGDLKVEQYDTFPKLICDGCTSELLVAAKFREKCQRTQKILSQFIHTENEEEIVFMTYTSNNPDESEINLNKEFDGKIEDELIIDDNNEEDAEFITVEESDIAKENSPEENAPSEIFEEIEFLDIHDGATGQVRIEANFEDMIVENQPSDVPQINDDDQELYDRIVKAAKTSAYKGFSPRSPVFTKPLVINCKCDVCGAGFTHFNNLRRHLQTHDFDEIYTCTVCSCPFTKSDKFNEHILEHEQEFISKTEAIDKEDTIKEEPLIDESLPSNVKKKTFLKSALNYKIVRGTGTHIDADIKDRKKHHVCPHCNKRFVSKSALKAHSRIHTGDKPFRCYECQKSFTTHGGLVLHMRRHIGLRPFACSVCDKRFVESSNLKVHMRIHTGEKPHKCTVCERSFARVFLLQLHQRTHTGERPYQCPFCDKAFSQQGDLASHKRIHTGERPHQCPFCMKGFIKSSALTQHVRKHSKFDKQKLETENTSSDVNIEIIDVSDIRRTKMVTENGEIKHYDILIVEDEGQIISQQLNENNDEILRLDEENEDENNTP